MYVAEVPTRNSRPTYLLRESYREDGKVKNRTLGNVSRLPDERIQLLRRVLRGEPLVSADDALRITRSLPHGHVQAVLDMVRRLELPRLIASRPSRRRELSVALIVQRILYPGSKPAATRLWKKTTLADELGVADAEVDEVYEALDWLLARQKRIENKLAHRHLADGEQALRSLKGLELLVRPIFHRLDGRVRAHVFVCLLAYCVQWHLKRASAPLWFADEHLVEHRRERDPVASADPAPELRAKKAARRTEDGHELQSFRELLAELATQCRNTCEFGNVESPLRVTKLTDPTPLGREAFRATRSNLLPRHSKPIASKPNPDASQTAANDCDHPPYNCRDEREVSEIPAVNMGGQVTEAISAMPHWTCQHRVNSLPTFPY